MLTNENIKELRKLGDTRDRVEWRIGEIALEAWNRNIQAGGELHRFQVFTAVARESRCSKGRVEKLYAMVNFYPTEIRQKYPGYKLGHYETAMNFGPEKAPEVLEYISVYKDDKGELPKVNTVDFLYRRDVLGQETEVEIKRSPPMPEDPPEIYPDALHARIVGLLKSLKSMIENKNLPGPAREKIGNGLREIEEGLALIDTPEIINYT